MKRPPTDLEVARAIHYNESLRAPEPAELEHEEVLALFDEPAAEAAVPFWTVAIYLCDRVYGGPEEGGWWYNTGLRVNDALDGVPLCHLLTVFNIDSGGELAANGYVQSLQTLLDATVNVGRRDINSVLSTGRYYAEAHPGHPPAHYPERTPHYE